MICQGNLDLLWHEKHKHKLPRYSDWLRGTNEQLWCSVATIQPPLILPWRYTDEQKRLGQTWICDAVWLHDAATENGSEESTALLFDDLQVAINQLAQNKQSAEYTLLVNPSGMEYDARRLGGDHQIRIPSGRIFTFSVRRGHEMDDKILLALSWRN